MVNVTVNVTNAAVVALKHKQIQFSRTKFNQILDASKYIVFIFILAF